MNFHKSERGGGRGSDPAGQANYYLHDTEEDRGGRSGRGDSVAGAFGYAAHDKGARTSHRVGAVLLLNLATENPHEAAAEMQATIDAAAELKRRAGIPPSGQECADPVYAFSLNWHPDDNPDAAHMMETARETLRVLGLQEHQAMAIEHKDKPHKHVHVMVNLIHPDTGRVADLWRDEQKMDYWCYRYEIRAGVIRSPERANKYEGRDANPQHLSYDMYMAQKRAREQTRTQATNDNRTREAERQARAAWQPRAEKLRELQDASYQRRRAEAETLWRQYRDAQGKIRAACAEKTAAIWNRKRSPRAWPVTAQGLRDFRENVEWTALSARQKQRSKLFDAFERSVAGRIFNAALHLSDAVAEGKSRWRAAFDLASSGDERRRLFEARLKEARNQLFEKHGTFRRVLVEKVRRERDGELRQLAESYRAQLKDLRGRHAQEVEQRKAAWRSLNAERQQAIAQAREQAQRQPARDERPKAPARPFNIEPEVAAAVERAMQAPRTTREPSPHRDTGGWTRRRSAEERRADGDYRPRDRGREHER